MFEPGHPPAAGWSFSNVMSVGLIDAAGLLSYSRRPDPGRDPVTRLFENERMSFLLVGFAIVVLGGLGFWVFVAAPVRAQLRRTCRWATVLHSTEAPRLERELVERVFQSVGASLDPDEAGPAAWAAKHPTDGVYEMQLLVDEDPPTVPATSAKAPHRLQFELRKPLVAQLTETEQSEMRRALCRLAAAFARETRPALVSLEQPMSTDPNMMKTAPVTEELLAQLSEGRPDALVAVNVAAALPNSIRELFVGGEELTGTPRTFRVTKLMIAATPALRHYYDGQRSFDWARACADLAKRGSRAVAREGVPGVMLIEFPDIILEVQGAARPAWVMFELKGKQGARPKVDLRLAGPYGEWAERLPQQPWRYVLYDNNNGLPASLRLKLLAEVARVLAEQHRPLMLGWDDAGHLIEADPFLTATDEQLPEHVIALRINKVANAPSADKACFVSTTGLAELALPEIEMISSFERAEKFSPLIQSTAAELVRKGPIFLDGETVGYDASFAGRLQVLYARSLESEERFVMALS